MKGNYLELNPFIIQHIANDGAIGKHLFPLPWTLSDMLGLEHSATYMAEIQNFLSCTVGGIVHRL